MQELRLSNSQAKNDAGETGGTDEAGETTGAARIARIARIAGSAAAAMTERLSGTVPSHMPSVHGQVNTVRAQPIHRD